MSVSNCFEEQLQVPRIPIDQLMQLNRQAMVKVREVSKTEVFRRCQSCSLLVATVIDLAAGLYGLVILSILKPTSEGDTVSSLDQNKYSSNRIPGWVRCRVMEKVPDRLAPAVQSLRFSSLDASSSIRINKRCSPLQWYGMICDDVLKPSNTVVKKF
jgi:hypothetical protein